MSLESARESFRDVSNLAPALPTSRIEKAEPFMALTPLPVSDIYELLELHKTQNRKKLLIDTDTYNEVDDQFAIVHAVLSHEIDEKIDLLGITAAPFHNVKRATRSYGHGMELSYAEIKRVIDLLGTKWDGSVSLGSEIPVSMSEKGFVDSPAAREICEIASSRCSEADPLYIVALGALTNVASAVLMEPDIRNKIVICTMGGLALNVPNFNDANYEQDMEAAQIVFASGAPVVHFPGYSVTDMLSTTRWELKANIFGLSEIGDFLYRRFMEYVADFPGSSKPIWDLAPGAWVMDHSWFVSGIMHTPILNNNNTWSRYTDNHPMRTVKWLDRDCIFRHFFELFHIRYG